MTFIGNCMWLETLPGLGDFQFVSMSPGQMLKWDGRNLEHGNSPNMTGVTRVSIDFRVLPVSAYKPDNAQKSVARGLKFVKGEYYELADDLQFDS